MAKSPQTFDEYLAGVSDDKRMALEKLRKVIKAAAPKAKEYINYGVPAFHMNGKMLVGFGATAHHCSYYPGSGSIVALFRNELENFSTSKGDIRFLPDKPLPVSLVRKLVRARLAELNR